MDGFLITVLSNIGMISFVALSAYILLLSGQISFGQQAYFGIGAYVAGIATVMWQWPLAGALLLGALTAAAAAGLVGLATLRLSGIYFAMATLAFAEIMRIAAELFVYRREIGGVETGPDGIDGFRDIRYFFANDVSPLQTCLIVYALLVAVLAVLFIVERTRGGRMLRQVGEDPLLAEVQGIDVMRVRMIAALSAGAVAGLGGGLYAHLLTYVEPRSFDIMLGVHSLAYGLIGGLGTALGPLLGVLIDVGLLESTRLLWASSALSAAAILVAVVGLFVPRRR